MLITIYITIQCNKIFLIENLYIYGYCIGTIFKFNFYSYKVLLFFYVFMKVLFINFSNFFLYKLFNHSNHIFLIIK